MRPVRTVLFAMALACAAVACAHSGSSSPSSTDRDAGQEAGGDGSVSTVSDAAAPDAPASDAAAADAASEGGGPACPTPPEAGSGDAAVPLATGGGPATSAAQPLTVDGHQTGGTFDGVGAISASGTARLLADYPEPARSQILDGLFKPDFGAGVQLLKVEIGSDMGSIDGAEPSHMRSAGELSCGRGFEWWLMEQAKARNPSLRLYGLAWGAPGWVGSGSFWSADMIQYLVSWLGCAKKNGLTIDYLGGWDENGYDKDWFEDLHDALVQGGYATKIVAADSVGWAVADDMTSDPTFAGAVDVVGVHDPCGGEDAGAATCATTKNALGLGKPLWASEMGGLDTDQGAAAMARAIVRGYAEARLTATLDWALVAAVPPGSPVGTTGLVVASQPWSGAYEVGKSAWVSAQVTQFAQPGWLFLDSTAGTLHVASEGDAEADAGSSAITGSYVALEAPGASDYSVILETTTAIAPQTVALALTGGLSTAVVHVWTTDLSSSDAPSFVHAADVTPIGGAYWITLPPQSLVTLTTTTGQTRGATASLHGASAPLPHLDGFETPPIASYASGLADQEGAFEIAPCAGGRTGQCVQQMAAAKPIEWKPSSGTPYALLGPSGWTDYSVQADVLLENSGSVEVLGRYGGRDATQISHIAAYLLTVNDKGQWAIERSDTGGNVSRLQSGGLSTFALNTWHTLRLDMLGSSLTATIDGAQVGTATDATYPSGPAGLATGFASGSWMMAQFDNLKIEPLGAPPASFTERLVNRATGLALDVTAGSAAQGALVEQTPVDQGSTSQQWQLFGDGAGGASIVDVSSGLALETPASAAGTQLDQRTSDGAPAQAWQIQAAGDGYYRLFGAGGLVADGSGESQSSAAVVAAKLDCGSTAQEWSLLTVPVGGMAYVFVNQQTGLALDIDGQSTSEGAGIVEQPVDGSTSQQWRLKVLGGGLLSLVDVHGGLVLDVPRGNTTAGTQLDAWSSNGTDNQQWALAPRAGGTYAIVSSNGNALDVQGTGPGGGVVEQPPSSAALSQQWVLLPVP